MLTRQKFFNRIKIDFLTSVLKLLSILLFKSLFLGRTCSWFLTINMFNNEINVIFVFLSFKLKKMFPLEHHILRIGTRKPLLL